jgi:hypothetical protein
LVGRLLRPVRAARGEGRSDGQGARGPLDFVLRREDAEV